MTSRIQAL